MSHRAGPRSSSLFLAFLAAMLAFSSSHGQSPIEGLLQAETGNPIQRAIGEVVEDICPPGTLLSADLQARCNEIVGAAVISGNDIGNARIALQGMANEETSAMGTSAVDARGGRSNGAGRRVQSARAGGLASTITVNGESVALEEVWGHRSRNGLSAGGGGSPWSIHINVGGALSDREGTALQSGFDADSLMLNVGAEYELGPASFVGVTLGHARHDADLDANGGDIETKDYQIEVYGSWYGNDGWYVDGTAGLGTSDIDQRRNINYQITTPVNQVASSDTESDQFWASGQVGFDFYRSGWTIGPYARLEYHNVEIDGFTERMSAPNAAGSGLATQMDDQDITSVPLSIGVRFAREVNLSGATLVPQFAIEWVHEFDNDNDDITGRFVDDSTGTTFRLPTDKPDRNYGKLSAGASYSFSDTTTGHLVYQTLLGFRDLSTHAVQAGLRIRW